MDQDQVKELYATDSDYLQEICKMSQHFYQQGHLPATAGNFSLRSSKNEHFWVTVSGVHKGFLKPQNFLLVTPSFAAAPWHPAGLKPSWEAILHKTIYENVPQTGAIFHLHPLSVLKINQPKVFQDKVFFKGFELLKAFKEILLRDGPAISEKNYHVPFLKNHFDLLAIAQEMDRHFKAPAVGAATQDLQLPFSIIENHGLNVWGNTLEDTFKHTETALYLLEFLTATRNEPNHATH